MNNKKEWLRKSIEIAGFGILILTAQAAYSVQAEDIDEIIRPVETEYTEADDSEVKLPEMEPASRELVIEDILGTMTLEEKVAQLFIVLPEAITQVDCVVAAEGMTEEALMQYPVGGFIYMESNLQSEEQVKTMLQNVQEINKRLYGIPLFTCLDEEGGSVTRISGRGFDVPYIGDMCEIGYCQDYELAYDTGVQMGNYLSEYGFNVDFAPVADVLTNPYNYVVRERSFGSDPELVANMAMNIVNGLHESGVLATLKHFPGHGATAEDSHDGFATTDRTYEEMKSAEWVPFIKGIEENVDLIMIGHITVPGITSDTLPASLSYEVITKILREDLGYDGLVITDALNMGAISQYYSSSEAAIMTMEAGADLILMPADFYSAYEGVLNAVQSGILTEERIDTSVRRILTKKLSLS